MAGLEPKGGTALESSDTDTDTSNSFASIGSTEQPCPPVDPLPLHQVVPASEAEYSDSDVSMEADSDDDEDVPMDMDDMESGRGLAAIHQPVSPFEGSRKRKIGATGPEERRDDIGKEKTLEDNKRIKFGNPGWTSLRAADGMLLADKSRLPGELWHHIFTFTPPRDLGRLLRVNKKFNSYLDPSFPPPASEPQSLSVGTAKSLSAEAIWQASRKLFRVGMPAPLEGKTELDMWKLACGKSCQYCQKLGGPVSATFGDPWHAGPGENGVRAVWPFAVRACGSCLQQMSVKVGLSSRFQSPQPIVGTD